MAGLLGKGAHPRPGMRGRGMQFRPQTRPGEPRQPGGGRGSAAGDRRSGAEEGTRASRTLAPPRQGWASGPVRLTASRLRCTQYFI